MNTETISGKTFVEEDYPIQDIGGGVISKGQAVRHFEKKHPEYTVVAISSFKIDHQAETISVRVQVRPKSVVLPDDNQKPVDPMTVAPAIDQKLLNPGYDELLVQAGNLVTENTELKRLMDELSSKYEELKAELEVTRIAALAPCEKCDNECDKAEDSADFYELKKAHAKLQDEYDTVVSSGPFAELAPTAEEVAACAVEIIQDAADLSDAKDVVAENDTADMPDNVVEEQGDKDAG